MWRSRDVNLVAGAGDAKQGLPTRELFHRADRSYCSCQLKVLHSHLPPVVSALFDGLLLTFSKLQYPH